MFEALAMLAGATNVPDEPRYGIVITRTELAALDRVLSTQIQRALYEHDARIRRETAAIEAFMDRAMRALGKQQGEGHAGRMGAQTA